jgi:hypothetical protein
MSDIIETTDTPKHYKSLNVMAKHQGVDGVDGWSHAFIFFVWVPPAQDHGVQSPESNQILF